MIKDEFFMQKAIELAWKAKSHTNPNPLVGCVIVKDDKIISTGYHKKFGDYHAERNAILKVNKSILKNATLYVTLEPCNHHGKTPPCIDLILESKISRVVIGCTDPNQYMDGKSIDLLKQHGIDVTVGVLQEKCYELIKEYVHFHKHKKPFVCAKLGMSLDGQVATNTGESQWITSESSRYLVHESRAKYMAIMVGINTVWKDNPLLTTRIEGLQNPIRIICDSKLRIPLDCNICKTSHEIKTYIATCNNDKNKWKELEKLGCKLILCKSKNNQIDLEDLLDKLKDLDIISIYLEGGPTLITSFLKQKLVDEIEFYLAPILLGSTEQYSVIHDLGINKLSEAIQLEDLKVELVENDILYKAKVKYV